MRAQLTWLLDDVGIPLDWCAHWPSQFLHNSNVSGLTNS